LLEADDFILVSTPYLSRDALGLMWFILPQRSDNSEPLFQDPLKRCKISFHRLNVLTGTQSPVSSPNRPLQIVLRPEGEPRSCIRMIEYLEELDPLYTPFLSASCKAVVFFVPP